MGAQVGQRSSVALFIRRLEWKNDLRIPHVECVEKRLMMDERSVLISSETSLIRARMFSRFL